jgi:hypothetical protein
MGALDALDQALGVALLLRGVEGAADFALDPAVDVLDRSRDVSQVGSLGSEGLFEALVGALDRVVGRVQNRLDDEEIGGGEDPDRDQEPDNAGSQAPEEVAQDVHGVGRRLSCDAWRRTPRS